MMPQVETLKEASKSFKDYSQGQVGLAIAVASVFGLIVLAVVLYSWIFSRGQGSQWRLFRQFGEASGLTGAEVKLLTSLAERVQPDNPATLFVKRSLFEGAVSDLGIDPGRADVLRRKVYAP